MPGGFEVLKEMKVHKHLRAVPVIMITALDDTSSAARCIDMGAEDYLIASSLLGVLAQRLVRVVCPHCKIEEHPVPEMLDEIGFTRGDRRDGPDRFFEGRGCDHCGNTGFTGRMGIFELMTVNDDIRKLTVSKADSNLIRKKALENGSCWFRWESRSSACLWGGDRCGRPRRR